MQCNEIRENDNLVPSGFARLHLGHNFYYSAYSYVNGIDDHKRTLKFNESFDLKRAQTRLDT